MPLASAPSRQPLVFALAAACLLSVVSPAVAQNIGADSAGGTHRASPIARAHRIATPPLIDGRLDDDGWRAAQPFAGFVQRELQEGAPVTERTEVRILTDGDALYVGAWLYLYVGGVDIPGEKVRDVTLTNSDYFAIILDSYLDRQNGFVFATTPAAVADATVKALAKGRRTVWVPPLLRPVFSVFRHLPGPLWRRLPLS